MMDDFPDELWVEMDGGLPVIHNHNPKLPALIATGYLKKYVPAEEREVEIARLREAIRFWSQREVWMKE